MSDTCIVCLGDLGESANDARLPFVLGLEEGHAGTTIGDALLKDLTADNSETSALKEVDLIAHLLPCGHNLHDGCLKPWVERANSCPICRQNFNQVNLSTKIGGECVTQEGLA